MTNYLFKRISLLGLRVKRSCHNIYLLKPRVKLRLPVNMLTFHIKTNICNLVLSCHPIGVDLALQTL
jgi:hypothetical protein